MGIYVKPTVAMGLLADITSGTNITDRWIINKSVFRKR